MNNDIYILGAGTYGEVILELAEDCGFNVLGFYDDEKSMLGKKVLGVEVVGTIKDLLKTDFIKGNQFVTSIGNNRTRKELNDLIIYNGGSTPKLVHPDAKVSRYAEIQDGAIIHAASYVFTGSVIEQSCIISPNSGVSHHTHLHKGVFVSFGATVGAYINIEESSFVGMASNISTNVKTLGRDCLIGAGAVVIRDVPENAVVIGNPAKYLRENH